MTELKRRKTLTDPEAIRQEIIKQQAYLDQLHNLIIQSISIPTTTIASATTTTVPVGGDGCSGTSSGSKDNCNQRRRCVCLFEWLIIHLFF